MGSTPLCPMHKCGKSSFGASPYCADHTCSQPKCCSGVAEEAKFCLDHKCAQTRCVNRVYTGKLCIDHSCQHKDCQNAANPASHFCLVHTCHTLDCNAEACPNEQFCAQHRAAMFCSVCGSSKAPKAQYCSIHMFKDLKGKLTSCMWKDCRDAAIDMYCPVHLQKILERGENYTCRTNHRTESQESNARKNEETVLFNDDRNNAL